MGKKASTPTCAPKTAVAYARYSSAGQRDVSIEQQLADIRAFAKREGYTLVHEYADHARSGFKNVAARTAFQSMMAAADSGNFDTVICWKVDRFGRNREESALFKGRLRRFGVKVLYAMEPIPEGSAGVLLEGMLESTAEWYSRQLSENVLRGMSDNANKCLYNGSHTLGYTHLPDGRIVIQPDEAALVRSIFAMYCSGLSAQTISDRLASQGIRTKYGNPYAPQSIIRVISNDRYIGMYRWRSVEVPNGIPPIIEKAVFEDANRMRKKKSCSREYGVIDFLLTGKLFCGLCSSMMYGNSGTSSNGNRKYYYECSRRKKSKDCSKKMVRKEWIESLVVDFVLDYVLSDDQIEKTADAVMKLQAEEMTVSPLGAMEAEYAETLKQIDNINNAIAAGIWNSSTSQKLKTLEDSAETLRFSINSLKYSQEQLLDHDRVIFFLHQFTKGDRNDPLLRRHIVETFVNSIYLEDDHVDIVTNNCENNERFKLVRDPSTCSDSIILGVPTVIHPNTKITIFRIAV